MSVFKNLLRASFRGYEFLTPDKSKTGGKKTVDHEYPNADKRRYVEELGVMAETFSMTAIIHGSNGIQDAIRFETELEKAGRGLLIHPVYGQRQVVCTDYTMSDNDTDVGQFSYSLTFKVSEENISLSATGSNVNLISDITSNVKSSLDNAFIDRYKNLVVPAILRQSAGQALAFVENIGSIKDDVLNPIPTNITTLDGVLDAVENVAPTMVRSGREFITQIRGVYDAYENISADISSFYNGYIGQTSFGSDRAKKTLITQKRIDEENNLSVFEDVVRINALASAYESAAYKDYSTEIELKEVRQSLEESYDFIIDNSIDDSLIYAPEVKKNINDLRVATRQVLEQKQQNTWRIVDVDAGETSLSLMTYRYYGDIENIDTIEGLNPTVNYSITDNVIKGIA